VSSWPTTVESADGASDDVDPSSPGWVSSSWINWSSPGALVEVVVNSTDPGSETVESTTTSRAGGGVGAVRSRIERSSASAKPIRSSSDGAADGAWSASWASSGPD
jgi:hypothetical protein